ncbi:nucleoside diphosphate kinase, partial [Phycomyces nitens]
MSKEEELATRTTKQFDALLPEEPVECVGSLPAIQQTLALIKPDVTEAQYKQEALISMVVDAGFKIVREREIKLSLDDARLFYREHESKPFYDDLVKFMSSGSVYAMVLEKENAVQAWRELMGPTDSIKAGEIDPNRQVGFFIRALFGSDGLHNAAHGSDCLTSAQREIDIIF